MRLHKLLFLNTLTVKTNASKATKTNVSKAK